jgi:hypothetical protein
MKTAGLIGQIVAAAIAELRRGGVGVADVTLHVFDTLGLAGRAPSPHDARDG